MTRALYWLTGTYLVARLLAGVALRGLIAHRDVAYMAITAVGIAAIVYGRHAA